VELVQEIMEEPERNLRRRMRSNDKRQQEEGQEAAGGRTRSSRRKDRKQQEEGQEAAGGRTRGNPVFLCCFFSFLLLPLVLCPESRIDTFTHSHIHTLTHSHIHTFTRECVIV
jgi:hypothetical protein